MSLLVLLLLLGSVPSLQEAAPADEERLEELYRVASLWQVGENREKVAKAREDLIALGEEALLFIIEKKLDTPRGLERRAIEAVIRGNGEAAIEPLLAKVRDGKPLERTNAAWLLGILGSGEEEPGRRERILAARPDLVALLEVDDVRLRSATLKALADLRDGESIEAIRPLLSDPTERTRREAAVSLGRIGDPRAAPALAPLLADPLFSIRIPAARALAGLGEEGGAALRAALSHEDFKVRGLAAEMLGKGGFSEAVDAIAALLGDPEGPVRAYAAEALGRLGKAEASAPLREALSKEADPFARTEMEKAIDLLEGEE